MPIREILVAIALFCNAAKGISALQLSRDLGCQYRTAFVLSHKLREAMKAEFQLSGEVEVDGCYVGGHVKPENRKEDRKDRRLAVNQTGKRQVVVVMRERNGRTLPFICRSEDEAVPTILRTRACAKRHPSSISARCRDWPASRRKTREIRRIPGMAYVDQV